MDIDSTPWSIENDGLILPFRPGNQTICKQNPPNFSWPYVEEADSYQIQVGLDDEMNVVIFDRQIIKYNFYNFIECFKTGKWYWRVRYHSQSGWSLWTHVRKFRIAHDACVFTVPPVEEIIRKIENSHPRIWTTPNTIDQFRKRAEGERKEWFSEIKKFVDENIDLPLPQEPSFPFSPVETITAEWMDAEYELLRSGFSAVMRMYKTAFAYLITDDARIGRNAVAQLLNLASWDVNGATGYITQDQVHRTIAYRRAIAYDWCYNLLSDQEKKYCLI